MIPYKQLSLEDIFKDCQDKFDNDKPAFLSLLENHSKQDYPPAKGLCEIYEL